MSYVYQRAMVREHGLNQYWKPVDISGMTISTILNTYIDAIAVLTNPFITGEVSFEITKNIPLFITPNLTLSNWLVQNGNTTLPTTAGAPSVTYVKGEYAQAHQANFYVRKVHPDTHPDVYNHDELLTDLLLSRSGTTDYEYIQKHMLVLVNGFFHRTESTTHGVYVKDGGRTSLIGKDNSLGVYSLANIGECRYIPITLDNLYKQHEDQDYSKRAYINVGEDLDNKVVLLSLAGVLHVLDDSYYHMGNGQVAIKTEQTNWARRFVELYRNINLQSVIEQMPTSNAALLSNPTVNLPFTIEELYNDNAIKQFLLLPQSFLIVIDTPYINTVFTAIQATAFPGVGVAYEKPTGLLRQRSGLYTSYTRVKQHHLWSVQFNPAYERQYYFETTDWEDLLIATDSEDILNLYNSGYGHLVEIGKEILQIE